MKYLISVIDDTTGSATPEEMAAIEAFNRRLRAEGRWIFAGGLGPPDAAIVIDNRGADAVFVPGPFLKSKEYISGFWIIEVPDHETALRLAAEASRHCNREVELRPFLADPS